MRETQLFREAVHDGVSHAAAEAFFEGQRQAFEWYEGVPARISYYYDYCEHGLLPVTSEGNDCPYYREAKPDSTGPAVVPPSHTEVN